jgi:hypothetical protein
MRTNTKRDAGKALRVALILGAECDEDLRARLSARGYSVLHARTVREASEALAEIRDDETVIKDFSEANLQILFRNLTPLEIRILKALLHHAGHFVPKTELYRQIYEGLGPIESRALDPHIRNLRRKLGPAGKSIESQRGVGVRWNPDPCGRFGLSPKRLLELLAPCRAILAVFVLALGFAAGWHLRPRMGGLERTEPGVRPGCETEELISPPPPAEAFLSTEGMAAAAGHGPECMIDGNTNTWFQTVGPARKRDLIQVLYRPNVRGRLSVRCGVPGSTNALPKIRVGVQYSDDEQRRLGFVDPATGAFSHDPEKPVYKVFVAVAEDSDEPFAVRSVRIDP